MRADNEQMLCKSTESHTDDAKPHQCPKKNWEGSELEMAETGKENLRCLFCESGGDKIDKERDRKMLGQDSQFSSKEESVEKGSVLYVDNSLTPYDLPEIVVCYKESTYSVVKDICVDEGVPVQEKFLFDEKDYGECILNGCGTEDSVGTEEVNKQVEERSDNPKDSTCDFKSLTQEHVKDDVTAEDIQKYLAKVCADTGDPGKYDPEDLNATGEVKDDSKSNIEKDMLVSDASELSVEDDSEKDTCAHHDSENLSLREASAAVNVVSKESFTLRDILSIEDLRKRFSNCSDEPEEQSSQVLIPAVEDPNNSNMVLSPERTADSAAKRNSNFFKNADMLDLSSAYTSQESIKTASPTEAPRGNSVPSLQINDPQKIEAEHHQMPRFNCLFEESNDHPLSSDLPSGFGESSFSAAEPVSGHITYSGPIAVSGSLSVRSDGSTTSTHSFAFPVLQPEWNSSPVRMARAEKRHHRSWKRWRQTLLCCKF